MAIQSMTGFARHEGAAPAGRFVWEMRSVNGKSLDVRLRLPPGTEHLEQPLKKLAGDLFSRGNIQATLTLPDSGKLTEAVVNQDALDAVVALAADLKTRIDAAPPTIDGLLSIRGVLEFREPDLDEDARSARDLALTEGFSEALKALCATRESEGRQLAAVLLGQISQIESLTARVENDASRSPDAIRQRLAGQVAQILQATQAIDPDRLAAEAALLAAKADLREEIDRLKAHVAAARDLLSGAGPAGRRLDFLAQEFNRESNTICSKSNAASVTATGLDLKVVIDQFREQVQNLE